MKIILLKQVNSLGRKGELKEVAEGYARNYLLPQNLALAATESNIKKYATAAEAKVAVQAVKTKNLSPEEIANRLRSLAINFSEKADDNGTLFAGITKEKLLKALENKGYIFKPKQIELAEAIKKLGEHRVAINVAARVKSEVKIIVSKTQ